MQAKIIYGTDEKGRIYTKNQLGGEVLAIHRWKSIQHYVDDKPSAKITQTIWEDRMTVSSGNSHHLEPVVGVAWSSEPPSAPNPPRAPRPTLRNGLFMSWSDTVMEALQDE